MKTTQKRAAKGGEVGANGEWYEGGKFIANTERPKSHKPSKKATRKQEVAPFKWEVAPEGMGSIFKRFAGTACMLDKDGKMIINPNINWGSYGHDYDEEYRQKAAKAAELYNSGEKWIAYEPQIPLADE